MRDCANARVARGEEVNVIPLHLSLRNVRTFEEFDLDLPEGMCALLGSNGAGKSSVVNSIEVALFGPEGRSLADWYPRGGGEEPLVITLTFEHGPDLFRVRRSFSPKGRGVSKVDLERVTAGERIADLTPLGAMPDADGMISHAREAVWEPLTLESQTATQERIEGIIGISRDTFRASSFLAQGEAGRFAEAPARDRKRWLGEIIGLGQWDEWLDRARKEKRVAELAVEKIAGSLERAEGELAERSLIEQEREEAILQRTAADLNLKETLAALTTARDALAEAEKQAERRAGAEKAVQDAERQLSDVERAVRQRESEIAMIDVRLAERFNLEGIAGQVERLATDKDSLVKALQAWKERERLERELAQATADSERAAAAAKNFDLQAESVLAGIGIETCDRCGQVLHKEAAKRAAASFAEDAEAHRQLAHRFDEQAKDAAQLLTAIPSEQPDATRLPMLERSLADAQGAKARLAALEEAAARKVVAEREADEMRAGLRECEQALVAARAVVTGFGPHDPQALGKLANRVRSHETDEANYRLGISQLERAIAGADTNLARLDKIAADVHDAHARRDDLLSELDLLIAMEKACGPNGVPALILENVAIPQVEAEATRILGLLGGPAYACELRTLREKKTGGLSGTLDIVLLTETGDAAYECFSTGEKARIAFALRLALAQLLANRKGSSTGLLVIDEIGGLDAEGISALLEVLEDLARKILRILVISHVPELRDSFENVLMLENVDGHSRIVGALV